MERIAVIARLASGAEGTAQTLLEGGPPFDPGTSGLAAHSVFIGNGLAVFVFEGDQVVRRLSDLVNDPVLSASFGAWAPVLADAPQLAHEAYHWRSDKDEST